MYVPILYHSLNSVQILASLCSSSIQGALHTFVSNPLPCKLAMTSWYSFWFKAQVFPHVTLLSDVSKWQLFQGLLSLIVLTQRATTQLSIPTPNI